MIDDVGRWTKLKDCPWLVFIITRHSRVLCRARELTGGTKMLDKLHRIGKDTLSPPPPELKLLMENLGTPGKSLPIETPPLPPGLELLMEAFVHGVWCVETYHCIPRGYRLVTNVINILMFQRDFTISILTDGIFGYFNRSPPFFYLWDLFI